MGGWLSGLFRRKEPQTPIDGPLPRIKNILKNNFRGLFGVLVGVTVFAVLFRYNERYKTVGGIWFMMLWFILLQPVAVTSIGLIPVFAFPMCGIISSAATCACLVNDNIVLLFLGSWLLLTLNNCGLDKRMACWFLRLGGDDGFSATKILLKSMAAAFFISIVCNSFLVVIVIMEYILPPLKTLSTYAKNEINYKEFTPILCNAIATSATIGSLCIVHGSITTLQFRAMFSELTSSFLEYPDIFNYLQYSAFAIPTAILMFLLNMVYHIVLIKVVVETKPMSKISMNSVKTALNKERNKFEKITMHHIVSVILLIMCLACFFTRWSSWLNMGWATFRRQENTPELPGVKDATTAAIFVMVMHLIPKSLDFFDVFTAKTEKDVSLKKASGVLFWNYIDKKTDYSLFLLIGSGIALYRAVVATGLDGKISEGIGVGMTSMNWNVGILIVVLLAVFMANIMAGAGAQAVMMPFFMSIASTGKPPWPERTYLVALGVGTASAFGFAAPFKHSTCYYSKTVGKVTLSKQLKYSILSILICTIVLYVTLCFYAPVLWEKDGSGIVPIVKGHAPSATSSTKAPTTTVATEKPPEGGPKPPPPPAET